MSCVFFLPPVTFSFSGLHLAPLRLHFGSTSRARIFRVIAIHEASPAKDVKAVGFTPRRTGKVFSETSYPQRYRAPSAATWVFFQRRVFFLPLVVFFAIFLFSGLHLAPRRSPFFFPDDGYFFRRTTTEDPTNPPSSKFHAHRRRQASCRTRESSDVFRVFRVFRVRNQSVKYTPYKRKISKNESLRLSHAHFRRRTGAHAPNGSRFCELTCAHVSDGADPHGGEVKAETKIEQSGSSIVDGQVNRRGLIISMQQTVTILYKHLVEPDTAASGCRAAWRPRSRC